MSSSATGVGMPICFLGAILLILTQKSSQKFGDVLGIMKSSLEEFCFRLLPYYPLGIVTCVLFILILFIISSCRIYEKKKGQIFLIIGNRNPSKYESGFDSQ